MIYLDHSILSIYFLDTRHAKSSHHGANIITCFTKSDIKVCCFLDPVTPVNFCWVHSDWFDDSKLFADILGQSRASPDMF